MRVIKSLLIIVLIGSFLFWSFVAGIERLTFFNANYYPKFLVHNKIHLKSKNDINKWIALNCHNQVDVIERKGELYIRCGLIWPTAKITKVYISTEPTQ